MVNLKKYLRLKNHFILILTFIALSSCAEKKYAVTRIEAKQISINQNIQASNDYEAFIQPYKKNIDQDLSSILAFAPFTLDKSGTWQSPIGNLQADITLKAAQKIFNLRTGKNVAICLLNNGGIRSIISKGNITTRTGFELMPFENNLVVVALKGEAIVELVNYFIREKKPHPLAGLTFEIKNNQPENIQIQKEKLDLNKTYYVATNDYLYNGGDRMDFFKKSTELHDLDYKIRNVWIDYFKEVDTIPMINDVRIITK